MDRIIYITPEDARSGTYTQFDLTVGPFRIGTAEQLEQQEKNIIPVKKTTAVTFATGISDPGHPDNSIGY